MIEEEQDKLLQFLMGRSGGCPSRSTSYTAFHCFSVYWNFLSCLLLFNCFFASSPTALHIGLANSFGEYIFAVCVRALLNLLSLHQEFVKKS